MKVLEPMFLISGFRLLSRWLNNSWATACVGKYRIDKTHDNVSYYAQSFSDPDYGTTHVAVLARKGGAVSVTTPAKLQVSF